MAENQQPRGRAHSCCGNGGPGKSWKCPNPTFPRFPPPLEIPHKTRDSHIPTAPATADRFHTQQRKAAKIEEFYRFSLRTHFTRRFRPGLLRMVAGFAEVADGKNLLIVKNEENRCWFCPVHSR